MGAAIAVRQSMCKIGVSSEKVCAEGKGRRGCVREGGRGITEVQGCSVVVRKDALH